MEQIAAVNQVLNRLVWGLPMLGMLLGAGLVLTAATGAVQFRHFGQAMKHTLGALLPGGRHSPGALSPAQTLATALAATVGTGNIAGVTWAVTLGGPGALFWLWVSAGLGMATKYTEAALALRYRCRNPRGDWVGGPMYYIALGLGRPWRWLAVLFALFGALAALGIGNAVQVSAAVRSVTTALSVCFPEVPVTRGLCFGLGLLIAVALGGTLAGGMQRLGRVTERLVPLMSLGYLAACAAVLLAHRQALPEVLVRIFRGAFDPASVVGGVGGLGLRQCMEWGLKRGVFSNEAGLGSSPIAHAASQETNPVHQGFYGIFEVFADSVICTMTGLSLLASGINLHYGVKGSLELNARAFATVFGPNLSALALALCCTLFALSTLLSWSLYGTRCWEFLLGSRFNRLYQTLFVALVPLGAVLDWGLVWGIADTLNGLMALPNCVALLGLAPVAAAMTKAHFSGPGSPDS